MLPPASASPETQICGQRLSTLSPLKERLRPPIGDHRLKSLAPSGGNVGLFWMPGNYASSGRLSGGAEGIRTPDLCSAIAALSHLSYSPVARLCTCAPMPCQRLRRGGVGVESSPLRRQ